MLKKEWPKKKKRKIMILGSKTMPINPKFIDMIGLRIMLFIDLFLLVHAF